MLNTNLHSENSERTLRRLRRRQRHAGRGYGYRGATVTPALFTSAGSIA